MFIVAFFCLVFIIISFAFIKKWNNKRIEFTLFTFGIPLILLVLFNIFCNHSYELIDSKVYDLTKMNYEISNKEFLMVKINQYENYFVDCRKSSDGNKITLEISTYKKPLTKEKQVVTLTVGTNAEDMNLRKLFYSEEIQLYCKNCNVKIEENQNYCINCGEKLNK